MGHSQLPFDCAIVHTEGNPARKALRKGLLMSNTATWQEVISPGRFDNQNVVVTGAGSGIGLATALRIAREGGRVVLVDMNEERLNAVVAEHHDLNLVPVVANITQDADIKRIVEAAGEVLDGLVNNAGVMDRFEPLGEVDDDVWNRVLAVNVTGTMKVTRALLPALQQSKNPAVVNLSSEAGIRGSAAGAAYTASKHAVIGLTRSGSYAYGPSGIRFNAVAPGGVATNIEVNFESELGLQRFQEVAGRLDLVTATSEQLAASITWLVSRDSTNVSGVVLASDGGWNAL